MIIIPRLNGFTLPWVQMNIFEATISEQLKDAFNTKANTII